MAQNFHESFQEEAPPLPSERSTGIVFAVVALIVGGLFRADWHILTSALLVSCLFAAAAFWRPSVLGPLNVIWFKFALLLNKFVSPVIMFVLFAGVIVPAGMLMRLRHDPLRTKRVDGDGSYWIDRTREPAVSSMINQF